MSTLLPNKAEIEAAAATVYAAMPATPQYSRPLLNQCLQAEVWVKHENHTPTGSFKLRGGLVYMRHLAEAPERAHGVIAATRGNHGQSVGFSAQRNGFSATVIVPKGNSCEKNASMRALGVELVEHGNEFQESREYAAQLARQQGLHLIPSFHPHLVSGVATAWMELLLANPDLDVLFVPIGQGSGICAAVAARAALGLRTRIIGVVSSHALAYGLSFAQKKRVESPVTTVIADGMACRIPDEAALSIIWEHVEDVVAVSDDEVAAAMKLYFTATHNVAEGAGAASLAAAMKFRQRFLRQKIGLMLSGGNVDHDMFAEILLRTTTITNWEERCVA